MVNTYAWGSLSSHRCSARPGNAEGTMSCRSSACQTHQMFSHRCSAVAAAWPLVLAQSRLTGCSRCGTRHASLDAAFSGRRRRKQDRRTPKTLSTSSTLWIRGQNPAADDRFVYLRAMTSQFQHHMHRHHLPRLAMRRLRASDHRAMTDRFQHGACSRMEGLLVRSSMTSKNPLLAVKACQVDRPSEYMGAPRQIRSCQDG